MTNYMLIFMGGGVPQTEEEAQADMAAWMGWMEAVGDRFVDDGNPFGKSWTVTAEGAREGGNAIPLMGYAIIKAETIEEACALAQGNPMVAHGGQIEVTPIVPIEM